MPRLAVGTRVMPVRRRMRRIRTRIPKRGHRRRQTRVRDRRAQKTSTEDERADGKRKIRSYAGVCFLTAPLDWERRHSYSARAFLEWTNRWVSFSFETLGRRQSQEVRKEAPRVKDGIPPFPYFRKRICPSILEFPRALQWRPMGQRPRGRRFRTLRAGFFPAAPG